MRRPTQQQIESIVRAAVKALRKLGAKRWDARTHPWGEEGWDGGHTYTVRQVAREVEVGKRYRLFGYNDEELMCDAIIRVPDRDEFEAGKPVDFVVEATWG